MTQPQLDKPQMLRDGEILFEIRHADLMRAIRQVQANAKHAPDIKSVDILVSEIAMTVRSVGIESEFPIVGIQPGTFQMPIAVLKQIAAMQKTTVIALSIRVGEVSAASSTVRHPKISLSRIPNLRISFPVDVSDFDLLVIARLFNPDELQRQGLADRVSKTREKLTKDVRYAATLLSSYHVTKEDLEAVIERIQKEAEPRLRAAVFS